ncbi:MAG: glycine cleavage system protein R [Woeseiaceae bacterium]
MSQLLVISAVGPDRTGVVHDLTQVVMKNDGNILESRMTALGSEFAMLLLVSGHWHTISKLEQALDAFAEQADLKLSLRSTSSKKGTSDKLPYACDLICMDQEGIVFNVSGFFSARSIEIAELNTKSYAAAHTGTPMFNIQANLGVPNTLSIAQLREEFMQFCDHMNIDGILEPIKH